MWFHRYEDGHDIEGRFDYNSWQESDQGLKLAASLGKDVVLAEGMLERPQSSDLCHSLTTCRLQRVPNGPKIHGPHGELAR